MKKIIKIIFLCLIFLVTGCSVEYDLIINEDGSVNETVMAQENTKRLESQTRLKGDAAVSYIYDMYKRTGKETSATRNDSQYTYTTVTKSYSSIDEYSKQFKSDVFEKFLISKNNDEITLKSNQTKILGGDSSYQLLYDDIKINITIPYKVISSNADEVRGNTYTWNIEKEKLKNIEVQYKEGSKKNNININIKNKTYNINYVFVGITAFVLIILGIVIVVSIKNKRNNIV